MNRRKRPSNGHGLAVVSLQQPWAYFVVQGFQTIILSSRSWRYRGLVWVLAKGQDDWAMRYYSSEYRSSRSAHVSPHAIIHPAGVIGSAVMHGNLKMWDDNPRHNRWETSRVRHLQPGAYPGDRAKFGWMLEDSIAFEFPYPVEDEPKGRISYLGEEIDEELLTWA